MKKEKFRTNILKILIIMLIVTTFLSILPRSSYAEELINPDDYKPAHSDTSTGTYRIKDMANRIIGTIQIIGSILSVAVIGILGIKYMLGSVEEKAEYKKTFKAYIIGAIMVFAITNILAIIVKISTNVFEI